MAHYTTNEFKSGLRILIDGDPYSIVENEMVKPGKGQAFNRVKIRNLKTGRTIERTFKSGESVEAADVVDADMQYLYSDGDFFHFMIPDNFEQHAASKAVVGDNAQWLKDGTVCIVTLWNGVPIVVTPPPHIELKVVETDPGLRGDTATGGQFFDFAFDGSIEVCVSKHWLPSAHNPNTRMIHLNDCGNAFRGS